MPIEFGFDRLHIERFRGIREFGLHFSQGIPTYLIGGNNTGKSTVLNAMAFALRTGGFQSYELTDFDFYCSPASELAEDFAVSLYFRAPSPEQLPAVQGVGSPIPVHGVRVIGRRRDGRLEHRHVLLDENEQSITVSPRTPLKGKEKEKYKDHSLGWAQYYARLDEIRSVLPEVWLLRPDNLERSLYYWQTGPLQRLAAILSERFLQTEWQFEYEGKLREMPRTMQRTHLFFQEAVQEFPFWKHELKPLLEGALSRYLGRSAVIGLRPDIQTFRDWLAQQLAAAFSAEAGGPVTPLRAMGHGWQALVRLAALEVLQGLTSTKQNPVLLLFEEPETYIHPHLRRKLRDVLEGLATGGWLIVCSTHASEFISFYRPQQIIRLWRTSDAITSGRLLSIEIPDGPKFQEKIDERGNHEFLFANRVIFCEGKDDRFALSTYFEKAQVDVDGLGITLLDLGGVENLPDYGRMAADLGIPWCGVTDEDVQSDGSVKPRTASVRENLGDLKTASDMIPVWPVSLENVLGITDGTKATPDWQQVNLVPKSLGEINAAYPKFASVAKAIASWAAGESQVS